MSTVSLHVLTVAQKPLRPDMDYEQHKWDFACSVSELESLGLQTPKLNELNDSYEIENLVEKLKQKHYQDYKSMFVFTDRL